MKIKVTRDDIDNGDKNHECRCPIARATNRAFGRDEDERYATVFGDMIMFPDREGEYDLPLKACDFIAMFDEGMPVRAFTFDLSFPEHQED